MAEQRFDRSPGLVEMEFKWARVLLPHLGTNKLYKRINVLRDDLKTKAKEHPGIKERKPTLAEFCKYFGLPVDESAHILNNRYQSRIIIASGPFCNQNKEIVNNES